MAAVDFLHHENPPTWSGVEPATLGADGQRQTNHATQPTGRRLSSLNNLSSLRIVMRERSFKPNSFKFVGCQSSDFPIFLHNSLQIPLVTFYHFLGSISPR
ncbi:hypothetical protein TNCV_2701591 [Trichonephila clavipes]|nr:hypothetical protein TNCV_2701591 [Trichonephila clavipes]